MAGEPTYLLLRSSAHVDSLPTTNRIGTYRFPSYYGVMRELFDQEYRGGPILDAGCGTGRFLQGLPNGVSAIGFDIDSRSLTEAKKSCPVVRGDIRALPFKRSIFQIVVCQDVLEHLKQPGRALDQIAQALGRNGVFIASTSNLMNPAMFIDSLLPNAVTARIVRRLGARPRQPRNSRFTCWGLIKSMKRRRFIQVNVRLVGHPDLGRWWEHANSRRTPLFYVPWIAWNELTNHRILNRLKEIVIIKARRREQ